MEKIWSTFGLVCAMSIAAMGQDLWVTSFSGDGMLTWTYPTNGVTSYRVEWASRAEGPYTNFTGSAVMLDGIAPTGNTMDAAVPMFYRVVAEVLPKADYMVINLSGGPSASSYPVSHLDAVPAGGWSDQYKTTKLVLLRIPGGTFTIGSPEGELGRWLDETQHSVTLTKDFYIGVFEVTQKQWERVMGNWPSYCTNVAYRDSRPVEKVVYSDIRGTVAGTNWPANGNVDADSFMGKLRAKTGQAFDLPTEAQWEYACRAGTTTALNSGDNLTNTSVDARMAEVGRYYYNGGFEYNLDGDTSVMSAKVGSFLPNTLGLYDMHGNVWEWCLDWYGTYSEPVIDPPGRASGSNRVRRGGGWSDNAMSCRSAGRGVYNPDSRYRIYGFRLSWTLP